MPEVDYSVVIQEDVIGVQSKGWIVNRSESKAMGRKRKKRGILIRKNELT